MCLSSVLPTDDSSHVLFHHYGHTYRMGKCIGKGGFGAVFSVLGKPQLVIKKIAINTQRQYQLIQQEIKLTRRQLNHPFILRSFGDQYDEAHKTMYILYERILGNPLNTHIQQWGTHASPTVTAWRWHIASQVCCGIHYLHTQGFTHRDIKPHNIMVQDRPLHAKLIDFGLSQRSDANTGRSGSKTYNAPEKFDPTYPQTHAIDLWSLGCLLFQLFFSKTLFAHSNTQSFSRSNVATIASIHQRLIAHIDTQIQVTHADPSRVKLLPLIRQLLNRDPNQRASAHEAYLYIKPIVSAYPKPTLIEPQH